MVVLSCFRSAGSRYDASQGITRVMPAESTLTHTLRKFSLFPGCSGGRSSAWLEPQIVDLAVAGSNPVDHPIFSCIFPPHTITITTAAAVSGVSLLPFADRKITRDPCGPTICFKGAAGRTCRAQCNPS